MKMRYRVRLEDPRAHEFEVEMAIAGNVSDHLVLSLPAWIPGSYMIRDFARNLIDLRVEAEGEAATVKKLDKQTWEIIRAPESLQVRYRVYAYDLSVRSAFFDDTRAYFNGTSLFLALQGPESGPLELELCRPGQAPLSAWHVATTLPAVSVDEHGFGLYRAENYQQLIDHPFEIGTFESVGFVVESVPHEMVFVDAPGADIERIARDLSPICAEHAAMFGELPISRYLFQTLATRDGYGGLEHRDSTSLICKRSDLPWPGSDSGIGKGYRQYLALCSHEYFHLWNVKRIRPQLFAEADLSSEVHSELLWAFEGITSYYDELALARAGTITHDDYLDMLAPSLTRYYRNLGRHRQSVAESSFDAWTRFYKQDENASNAIVSYYNKGALVALGLDLRIRIRSDDELGLDDLMRRLWQHYGRPGKGLPERYIERELEALLGESQEDFFDEYIYGTTELPLADWFAAFGVALVLRPADSLQDMGKFRSDFPIEPAQARPVLGARLSEQAQLVRVDQVFTGGAAQRAGVSPGDLLVALDGERCTPANVNELLRRRPVGDQAELSLFRRDRLRTVALPVMAAPQDTVDLCWLPDEGLSEPVKQRRARWLASVRG